MISAATVMALAASCQVAGVTPSRVVAAVEVESSFQTLAIHDNTAQRSFLPASLAEAVETANFLLHSGHRIDAGLMQISSANWLRLGLTVQSVFDPAANVCAGAQVLAEDYAIERRVSCRYNTGRPVCDSAYPERIQRALSSISALRPAGAAAPNSSRPSNSSRPEPPPVYDEPADSGLETVFAGGSR